MMNSLPEFSALLSRDFISTLDVYESAAVTSSDGEDEDELFDSPRVMSRRMPAPQLVTTQDLGLVKHPGGDPYNRFTAQSSAQTPKLVPNNDDKSGYRSDLSRDEAVCHGSTRNRHEQPMEVFNKSLTCVN